MTKIVDSFIFFNEIDLLLYRLSILNEYVDYFIIVESTHTFTGYNKKLYYNENKDLFKKFKDKIIHIIVDDFPYKIPNIDYNKNQQWLNEYYQRNCIKKGLDIIVNDINDNDVIITSDVDEIPNPDILYKIKNNTLDFNTNTLNRLEMDMYYYNLHCKIGDGNNWHGIKLITKNTYNKMNITFQQMRLLEHKYPVPIIKKGGWHLSYFGDIQYIKYKIESFSHQEYNNNIYINDDLINKINNNIKFLDNTKLNYINIEDNNNLPYKYEEYLTKYYKLKDT